MLKLEDIDIHNLSAEELVEKVEHTLAKARHDKLFKQYPTYLAELEDEKEIHRLEYFLLILKRDLVHC